MVWLPSSFFPLYNIGLLIIPIDVHIFQRGGPTINQKSMFTIKKSAPFFKAIGFHVGHPPAHYQQKIWTLGHSTFGRSCPSANHLLEGKWGFPEMGNPKNGWAIRENPIVRNGWCLGVPLLGCESECKAPIHTLNPQTDPYPRSIPKRRWSRPIHTSGSPRADPYPNFDANPYDSGNTQMSSVQDPSLGWRLY